MEQFESVYSKKIDKNEEITTEKMIKNIKLVPTIIEEMKALELKQENMINQIQSNMFADSDDDSVSQNPDTGTLKTPIEPTTTRRLKFKKSGSLDQIDYFKLLVTGMDSDLKVLKEKMREKEEIDEIIQKSVEEVKNDPKF